MLVLNVLVVCTFTPLSDLLIIRRVSRLFVAWPDRVWDDVRLKGGSRGFFVYFRIVPGYQVVSNVDMCGYEREHVGTLSIGIVIVSRRAIVALYVSYVVVMIGRRGISAILTNGRYILRCLISHSRPRRMSMMDNRLVGVRVLPFLYFGLSGISFYQCGP